MMDLSFENEQTSMAFAFGVVAMSIIAIASFFTGIIILFYVFAIIALALGFYMAYRISKEPNGNSPVKSGQKQKNSKSSRMGR